MAKEYTYMGKTLAQLQQMSTDEFAKLTTSRTRRTIQRGLDKTFLAKVMAIHQDAKTGKFPAKPVKTHLRDFVILPQMVGIKFAVYKGNTFEQVEIQPEMMGHVLGEYVLTRKRVSHGKAGIGSTKSSSAVTAK
ncbi:MAG: 30S ribosomal protein S19 [archaeon]